MNDFMKATSEQVQEPARAALNPGDEVFVSRRSGYNRAYDRAEVSRVTGASVFIKAKVWNSEAGGHVDGERRFNIKDGYEWGSKGGGPWTGEKLFAMTPLMVVFVEQLKANREQERWRRETVRTLRDYRYRGLSDETLQAILALLVAEQVEKSKTSVT